MADTAVLAPASHKQPSRKGRRAWRKNVDLTEVQQGLDDVRQEIIDGGVVAEKDSDQLFTADLTGDADIAGAQQKGKKLLKTDEILARRSAVPRLEGRKRKAKDEQVGLSASKKQRNGRYIPHKELQRLRAVADNANGSVAVQDGAAHLDLWAETTEPRDPRLSFLEESKPKREPKTLRHAPVSLAADRSRIPNVRKPDAGKSYNPLVSDWSALLEREGAAAVGAERERLRKEAEQDEREARALEEAAKVEAAERAEYGTDYDSAWESEWDGFQSESEAVFTQKPRSRKTPAERRKANARKEREAVAKSEKKSREREAQENKIRQIAKEVSAKDKARRAHAMALQPTHEASESSGDDGVEEAVRVRPRRFGQIAVPDVPLEVVLPDELEDSLRRLKPEGDLMTERYRNLLLSGKMEPRKKQWQRRQAKTTRTEKWSYKDWRLKS